MKILTLLLSLVLAVTTLAAPIKPPKGFDGKLYGSTLALYGTYTEKDEKGVEVTDTRFVCTARPYEKTKAGYHLITDGHCVQLLPEGMKFSITEEIGGHLTPVKVMKARDDGIYDFAVFDLETKKQYPLIGFSKETLRVGDKVVDAHFALGLAKQLSYGIISSQTVGNSEECPPDCTKGFVVQEVAGPGSSGAVVISEKTHKIIGLMVETFERSPETFIVEPIANFDKFLLMPNEPHPVEKEEK